MCGFCLTTGPKPANADAIEAILALRGPDGRGEIEEDSYWMLHRRLTVIDPSDRSSQPFVLRDCMAAENPHALVYNGEIYNYRDIQPQFRDLRTDGDTEIMGRILSGGGQVSSLSGMYAAAVVDGDTVRLTRDRFGIKPLYRSVDRHGQLHVASQLRCFHHLIDDLTIDQRSVACFLQFGNVHGATMFAEVDEVPPGTTEIWKNGERIAVESLPPLVPGGDLKNALHGSMQRHLVADVDIAVLLSAGLDSAVLAFLAKECGADPVAVTLAAKDGRDESEEAAKTAKAFGLRHEIIDVTETDGAEAVDEFFAAMDQPTIDGFNTFLVARAVRDLGIPVALSGLGADELFGGYSSFRRAELTHRFRHLPRPILAAVARRSGGNPAKVDRWINARHNRALLAQITREVLSPEQVEAACGMMYAPNLPSLSSADEIMQSEVWRYMAPTLLRDSDAFSMANSVELRVPFLDDAVVSSALARTSRQRATEGKRAIVNALNHPRLEEIMQRPKTGFELPIERWLQGSLGSTWNSPSRPTRFKLPTGTATWSATVLDRWLAAHEQKQVQR